MTIGLMNFVAMDWLQKINPRLVNIVQTEYSRELRENTQLAALVPRIANNIDAMLVRHDVVGSVENLSIDDMTVDTINRVRSTNTKYKGRNQLKNNSVVKRNKLFCPECHFLARKLNLLINYSHHPNDCPRPRAAVNLLLANEEAQSDNDD